MASTSDNSPRAYWLQTRRLTAILLLAWFLVTFVAAFFARDLRFTFLGWPFSFYIAAQGALLVYLLIVYLYARKQRARDQAFGVAEPECE